MPPLGGRRRAPGKHPRDHHQPRRAHLSGVGGMGRGEPGVHRPGADDDGDPRRDEPSHTLLSLLVAEQRPLPHRAAVDDTGHAGGQQFARRGDHCIEIGRAGGIARSHQCRQAAAEGAHRIAPKGSVQEARRCDRHSAHNPI